MEFRETRPIYLQIAEFVCEKILLKEWKPEERIPSVRELAVSIEVNPNTVMRTYEFLQQKEIIYNQRGVGLFVSKDAVKSALAYRREEFLKRNAVIFPEPAAAANGSGGSRALLQEIQKNICFESSITF